MKKILFVSSLQIFPPMSGGQLRSANLCRAFAHLGYEVEVYSITGRKEAYVARQPSFTQKIDLHIQESVNMNPVWGMIQFLFYKLQLPPLWVTWLLKLYVPSDLKRSLQAADQVVLDFPFLAPLFKHVHGSKILNTHNAEFELWDHPAVASAVKRVEVDGLNKAEKVIFCAEGDRQKFVDMVPGLTEKSVIVSNGIDVNQFKWDPSLRQEFRQKLGVTDAKVFLFTGSTYQPNLEAFEFIKSFADNNRQALIDLKAVIVVVGTVSQELRDEAHFKVLGRVAEITPYFAASDFGLNPVTQGSGVNVKMIEFMAARLPILSTAFGCRGLSLEDGKTCHVFSRDNMLQAMKKAFAASEDENKKLSALAFQQNETKVDMTKALLGTGL